MKFLIVNLIVLIKIISPCYTYPLDFYHTPVCAFYKGCYKTFPSVQALMIEIRMTESYWCLIKLMPCETIFEECTNELTPICAYSEMLDKFHTFTNECQMNREIHKTKIIWRATFPFACPAVETEIKSKSSPDIIEGCECKTIKTTADEQKISSSYVSIGTNAETPSKGQTIANASGGTGTNWNRTETGIRIELKRNKTLTAAIEERRNEMGIKTNALIDATDECEYETTERSFHEQKTSSSYGSTRTTSSEEITKSAGVATGATSSKQRTTSAGSASETTLSGKGRTSSTGIIKSEEQKTTSPGSGLTIVLSSGQRTTIGGSATITTSEGQRTTGATGGTGINIVGTETGHKTEAPAEATEEYKYETKETSLDEKGTTISYGSTGATIRTTLERQGISNSCERSRTLNEMGPNTKVHATDECEYENTERSSYEQNTSSSHGSTRTTAGAAPDREGSAISDGATRTISTEEITTSAGIATEATSSEQGTKSTGSASVTTLSGQGSTSTTAIIKSKEQRTTSPGSGLIIVLSSGQRTTITGSTTIPPSEGQRTTSASGGTGINIVGTETGHTTKAPAEATEAYKYETTETNIDEKGTTISYGSTGTTIRTTLEKQGIIDSCGRGRTFNEMGRNTKSGTGSTDECEYGTTERSFHERKTSSSYGSTRTTSSEEITKSAGIATGATSSKQGITSAGSAMRTSLGQGSTTITAIIKLKEQRTTSPGSGLIIVLSSGQRTTITGSTTIVTSEAQRTTSASGGAGINIVGTETEHKTKASAEATEGYKYETTDTNLDEKGTTMSYGSTGTTIKTTLEIKEIGEKSTTKSHFATGVTPSEQGITSAGSATGTTSGQKRTSTTGIIKSEEQKTTSPGSGLIIVLSSGQRTTIGGSATITTSEGQRTTSATGGTGINIVGTETGHKTEAPAEATEKYKYETKETSLDEKGTTISYGSTGATIRTTLERQGISNSCGRSRTLNEMGPNTKVHATDECEYENTERSSYEQNTSSSHGSTRTTAGAAPDREGSAISDGATRTISTEEITTSAGIATEATSSEQGTKSTGSASVTTLSGQGSTSTTAIIESKEQRTTSPGSGLIIVLSSGQRTTITGSTIIPPSDGQRTTSASGGTGINIVGTKTGHATKAPAEATEGYKYETTETNIDEKGTTISYGSTGTTIRTTLERQGINDSCGSARTLTEMGLNTKARTGAADECEYETTERSFHERKTSSSYGSTRITSSEEITKSAGIATGATSSKQGTTSAGSAMRKTSSGKGSTRSTGTIKSEEQKTTGPGSGLITVLSSGQRTTIGGSATITTSEGQRTTSASGGTRINIVGTETAHKTKAPTEATEGYKYESTETNLDEKGTTMSYGSTGTTIRTTLEIQEIGEKSTTKSRFATGVTPSEQGITSAGSATGKASGQKSTRTTAVVKSEEKMTTSPPSGLIIVLSSGQRTTIPSSATVVTSEGQRTTSASGGTGINIVGTETGYKTKAPAEATKGYKYETTETNLDEKGTTVSYGSTGITIETTLERQGIIDSCGRGRTLNEMGRNTKSGTGATDECEYETTERSFHERKTSSSYGSTRTKSAGIATGATSSKQGITSAGSAMGTSSGQGSTSTTAIIKPEKKRTTSPGSGLTIVLSSGQRTTITGSTTIVTSEAQRTTSASGGNGINIVGTETEHKTKAPAEATEGYKYETTDTNLDEKGTTMSYGSTGTTIRTTLKIQEIGEKSTTKSHFATGVTPSGQGITSAGSATGTTSGQKSTRTTGIIKAEEQKTTSPGSGLTIVLSSGQRTTIAGSTTIVTSEGQRTTSATGGTGINIVGTETGHKTNTPAEATEEYKYETKETSLDEKGTTIPYGSTGTTISTTLERKGISSSCGRSRTLNEMGPNTKVRADATDECEYETTERSAYEQNTSSSHGSTRTTAGTTPTGEGISSSGGTKTKISSEEITKSTEIATEATSSEQGTTSAESAIGTTSSVHESINTTKIMKSEEHRATSPGSGVIIVLSSGQRTTSPGSATIVTSEGQRTTSASGGTETGYKTKAPAEATEGYKYETTEINLDEKGTTISYGSTGTTIRTTLGRQGINDSCERGRTLNEMGQNTKVRAGATDECEYENTERSSYEQNTSSSHGSTRASAGAAADREGSAISDGATIVTEATSSEQGTTSAGSASETTLPSKGSTSSTRIIKSEEQKTTSPGSGVIIVLSSGRRTTIPSSATVVTSEGQRTITASGGVGINIVGTETGYKTKAPAEATEGYKYETTETNLDEKGTTISYGSTGTTIRTTLGRQGINDSCERGRTLNEMGQNTKVRAGATDECEYENTERSSYEQNTSSSHGSTRASAGAAADREGSAISDGATIVTEATSSEQGTTSAGSASETTLPSKGSTSSTRIIKSEEQKTTSPGSGVIIVLSSGRRTTIPSSATVVTSEGQRTTSASGGTGINIVGTETGYKTKAPAEATKGYKYETTETNLDEKGTTVSYGSTGITIETTLERQGIIDSCGRGRTLNEMGRNTKSGTGATDECEYETTERSFHERKTSSSYGSTRTKSAGIATGATSSQQGITSAGSAMGTSSGQGSTSTTAIIKPEKKRTTSPGSGLTIVLSSGQRTTITGSTTIVTSEAQRTTSASGGTKINIVGTETEHKTKAPAEATEGYKYETTDTNLDEKGTTMSYGSTGTTIRTTLKIQEIGEKSTTKSHFATGVTPSGQGITSAGSATGTTSGQKSTRTTGIIKAEEQKNTSPGSGLTIVLSSGQRTTITGSTTIVTSEGQRTTSATGGTGINIVGTETGHKTNTPAEATEEYKYETKETSLDEKGTTIPYGSTGTTISTTLERKGISSSCGRFRTLNEMGPNTKVRADPTDECEYETTERSAYEQNTSSSHGSTRTTAGTTPTGEGISSSGGTKTKISSEEITKSTEIATEATSSEQGTTSAESAIGTTSSVHESISTTKIMKSEEHRATSPGSGVIIVLSSGQRTTSPGSATIVTPEGQRTTSASGGTETGYKTKAPAEATEGYKYETTEINLDEKGTTISYGSTGTTIRTTLGRQGINDSCERGRTLNEMGQNTKVRAGATDECEYENTERSSYEQNTSSSHGSTRTSAGAAADREGSAISDGATIVTEATSSEQGTTSAGSASETTLPSKGSKSSTRIIKSEEQKTTSPGSGVIIVLSSGRRTTIPSSATVVTSEGQRTITASGGVGINIVGTETGYKTKAPAEATEGYKYETTETNLDEKGTTISYGSTGTTTRTTLERQGINDSCGTGRTLSEMGPNTKVHAGATNECEYETTERSAYEQNTSSSHGSTRTTAGAAPDREGTAIADGATRTISPEEINTSAGIATEATSSEQGTTSDGSASETTLSGKGSTGSTRIIKSEEQKNTSPGSGVIIILSSGQRTTIGGSATITTSEGQRTTSASGGTGINIVGTATGHKTKTPAVAREGHKYETTETNLDEKGTTVSYGSTGTTIETTLERQGIIDSCGRGRTLNEMGRNTKSGPGATDECEYETTERSFHERKTSSSYGSIGTTSSEEITKSAGIATGTTSSKQGITSAGSALGTSSGQGSTSTTAIIKPEEKRTTSPGSGLIIVLSSSKRTTSTGSATIPPPEGQRAPSASDGTGINIVGTETAHKTNTPAEATEEYKYETKETSLDEKGTTISYGSTGTTISTTLERQGISNSCGRSRNLNEMGPNTKVRAGATDECEYENIERSSYEQNTSSSRGSTRTTAGATPTGEGTSSSDSTKTKISSEEITTNAGIATEATSSEQGTTSTGSASGTTSSGQGSASTTAIIKSKEQITASPGSGLIIVLSSGQRTTITGSTTIPPSERQRTTSASGGTKTGHKTKAEATEGYRYKTSETNPDEKGTPISYDSTGTTIETTLERQGIIVSCGRARTLTEMGLNTKSRTGLADECEYETNERSFHEQKTSSSYGSTRTTSSEEITKIAGIATGATSSKQGTTSAGSASGTTSSGKGSTSFTGIIKSEEQKTTGPGSGLIIVLSSGQRTTIGGSATITTSEGQRATSASGGTGINIVGTETAHKTNTPAEATEEYKYETKETSLDEKGTTISFGSTGTTISTTLERQEISNSCGRSRTLNEMGPNTKVRAGATDECEFENTERSSYEQNTSSSHDSTRTSAGAAPDREGSAISDDVTKTISSEEITTSAGIATEAISSEQGTTSIGSASGTPSSGQGSTSTTAIIESKEQRTTSPGSGLIIVLSSGQRTTSPGSATIVTSEGQRTTSASGGTKTGHKTKAEATEGYRYKTTETNPDEKGTPISYDSTGTTIETTLERQGIIDSCGRARTLTEMGLNTKARTGLADECEYETNERSFHEQKTPSSYGSTRATSSEEITKIAGIATEATSSEQGTTSAESAIGTTSSVHESKSITAIMKSEEQRTTSPGSGIITVLSSGQRTTSPGSATIVTSEGQRTTSASGGTGINIVGIEAVHKTKAPAEATEEYKYETKETSLDEKGTTTSYGSTGTTIRTTLERKGINDSCERGRTLNEMGQNTKVRTGATDECEYENTERFSYEQNTSSSYGSAGTSAGAAPDREGSAISDDVTKTISSEEITTSAGIATEAISSEKGTTSIGSASGTTSSGQGSTSTTAIIKSKEQRTTSPGRDRIIVLSSGQWNTITGSTTIVTSEGQRTTSALGGTGINIVGTETGRKTKAPAEATEGYKYETTETNLDEKGTTISYGSKGTTIRTTLDRQGVNDSCGRAKTLTEMGLNTKARTGAADECEYETAERSFHERKTSSSYSSTGTTSSEEITKSAGIATEATSSEQGTTSDGSASGTTSSGKGSTSSTGIIKSEEQKTTGPGSGLIIVLSSGQRTTSTDSATITTLEGQRKTSALGTTNAENVIGTTSSVHESTSTTAIIKSEEQRTTSPGSGVIIVLSSGQRTTSPGSATIVTSEGQRTTSASGGTGINIVGTEAGHKTKAPAEATEGYKYETTETNLDEKGNTISYGSTGTTIRTPLERQGINDSCGTGRTLSEMGPNTKVHAGATNECEYETTERSAYEQNTSSSHGSTRTTAGAVPDREGTAISGGATRTISSEEITTSAGISTEATSSEQGATSAGRPTGTSTSGQKSTSTKAIIKSEVQRTTSPGSGLIIDLSSGQMTASPGIATIITSEGQRITSASSRTGTIIVGTQTGYKTKAPSEATEGYKYETTEINPDEKGTTISYGSTGTTIRTTLEIQGISEKATTNSRLAAGVPPSEHGITSDGIASGTTSTGQGSTSITEIIKSEKQRNTSPGSGLIIVLSSGQRTAITGSATRITSEAESTTRASGGTGANIVRIETEHKTKAPAEATEEYKNETTETTLNGKGTTNSYDSRGTTIRTALERQGKSDSCGRARTLTKMGVNTKARAGLTDECEYKTTEISSYEKETSNSPGSKRTTAGAAVPGEGTASPGAATRTISSQEVTTSAAIARGGISSVLGITSISGATGTTSSEQGSTSTTAIIKSEEQRTTRSDSDIGRMSPEESPTRSSGATRTTSLGLITTSSGFITGTIYSLIGTTSSVIATRTTPSKAQGAAISDIATGISLSEKGTTIYNAATETTSTQKRTTTYGFGTETTSTEHGTKRYGVAMETISSGQRSRIFGGGARIMSEDQGSTSSGTPAWTTSTEQVATSSGRSISKISSEQGTTSSGDAIRKTLAEQRATSSGTGTKIVVSPGQKTTIADSATIIISDSQGTTSASGGTGRNIVSTKTGHKTEALIDVTEEHKYKTTETNIDEKGTAISKGSTRTTIRTTLDIKGISEKSSTSSHLATGATPSEQGITITTSSSEEQRTTSHDSGLIIVLSSGQRRTTIADSPTTITSENQRTTSASGGTETNEVETETGHATKTTEATNEYTYETTETIFDEKGTTISYDSTGTNIRTTLETQRTSDSGKMVRTGNEIKLKTIVRSGTTDECEYDTTERSSYRQSTTNLHGSRRRIAGTTSGGQETTSSGISARLVPPQQATGANSTSSTLSEQGDTNTASAAIIKSEGQRTSENTSYDETRETSSTERGSTSCSDAIETILPDNLRRTLSEKGVKNYGGAVETTSSRYGTTSSSYAIGTTLREQGATSSSCATVTTSTEEDTKKYNCSTETTTAVRATSSGRGCASAQYDSKSSSFDTETTFEGQGVKRSDCNTRSTDSGNDTSAIELHCSKCYKSVSRTAPVFISSKTVILNNKNNTFNGPYAEGDLYHQPVHNYYNVVPVPEPENKIANSSSNFYYGFFPVPGSSSSIFSIVKNFLSNISNNLSREITN